MVYKFNFGALLPYWDVLLKGCMLTLWLGAISTTIGLSIGLVTVLGRRSRFPLFQAISTSYVEIIRNTPFLVQVFFIYFGLPSLGLSLLPWHAAVVALSLNLGAFSAEIIRAGIDSIPRGQFEAGEALGLSPLQTFRYVALKPALRTIFPALSGQFVLLLLTTSIVSSISAEELTSVAESVDSTIFRSFEVYIVTAMLYLAMSMIFSVIFKTINRIFFSYPMR
jgi:polar amino acid transport system permease protein